MKLLVIHGQYYRKLARISAFLFLDSKLIMVPYVTDNTAPPVPTIRSQIFNRLSIAWLVATFVLTPITAYYLAMAGYIPMNPVDAAINGFLFSIVYVGYRVIRVYRAIKMRSKMNANE